MGKYSYGKLLAFYEHGQVYEYEIICDIRGPSRPRQGPGYMEYSDYFILRFGGDNVLKGLVNESAEMLPPTDAPEAMGDGAMELSDQHFLQFDANLQDGSIMITADLFTREDQGTGTILCINRYVVDCYVILFT